MLLNAVLATAIATFFVSTFVHSRNAIKQIRRLRRQYERRCEREQLLDLQHAWRNGFYRRDDETEEAFIERYKTWMYGARSDTYEESEG